MCIGARHAEGRHTWDASAEYTQRLLFRALLLLVLAVESAMKCYEYTKPGTAPKVHDTQSRTAEPAGSSLGKSGHVWARRPAVGTGAWQDVSSVRKEAGHFSVKCGFKACLGTLCVDRPKPLCPVCFVCTSRGRERKREREREGDTESESEKGGGGRPQDRGPNSAQPTITCSVFQTSPKRRHKPTKMEIIAAFFLFFDKH